MLARLFKYDFKSMTKLVFPLSALAGIISILAAAALKIVMFHSDMANGALSLICGFFLVLSVIALFAYSVIVWGIILFRFYNNLYTDEGYLTFTLPVKPVTVLTSKLLSALCCMLISGGVLTAAALIILCFGTGEEFFNTALLENFFSTFKEYFSEFESDGVIGILMFVLSMIVSVIQNFCTVFLAITLGAIISKKHKVLVAIAAYFAINTVVSILTGIVNVLLTAANVAVYSDEVTSAISMFGSTMSVNAVVSLCISAICFFLCSHLMKNKLNLP